VQLISFPRTLLFGALFSLVIGTFSGAQVPDSSEGSVINSSAASSASYTSQLRNRISWSGFPLKVYFIRDENYTEKCEQIALDAFDRWVSATNGFVQYEVVDSKAQAKITVRFNPDSNNGHTMIHFWKGRIKGADINIGVMRGWSNDIECTAAHEFGHALGIDGHSDSRGDLMYPSHMMGSSFRISERDLQTFASIYPSFGKRRAGRNGNERGAGFSGRG
jgi:predicted Zn-dependent protease